MKNPWTVVAVLVLAAGITEASIAIVATAAVIYLYGVAISKGQ